MKAAPVPMRQIRQARLDQLRVEMDPMAVEEVRTGIRALLRKPLLLSEGRDLEAYRLVRRNQVWIRAWFAHHADWSLDVTADAARLRKLPARPDDAARGAVEPKNGEAFTRRRYVLLCVLLAALERSDRQVTLGRLAEALGASLAADPAFAAAGVTWSLATSSDRRDFVHVVRMLLGLGALRRVQGDEERFVSNAETDVLYGVVRPVLALLLAARRSPSLISETTFESRLRVLHEDPLTSETPDSRNRALRVGLVRRLLDDPVVYFADLDDPSRQYLESQRTFILKELTEATGLEAEVRQEGFALVEVDGDCTDLGMPEEGTEGHLTILLAGWLVKTLKEAAGRTVALEAVRMQTMKLIRQHRHHWRREVAEKGAEVWLTDLVLQNLAGLGLIERRGDEILPRPALGRFALRPSSDSEDIAETDAPDATGNLFVHGSEPVGRAQEFGDLFR